MTNHETNDEHVLGKGIEAIFRRTKQLDAAQNRTVNFARGVAYHDGDELILKIKLNPHERLLPILQHLVVEAEHGVFDPLFDRQALADAAVTSARKAADDYDRGNYGAAIQGYEQALTILEEPLYRFNLALAYERIGHLGTAAENYRLVIKANPSDAVAFNNLSFIYYQSGELELALEALTQAVTLNPSLAYDAQNSMFRSLPEPKPIPLPR